MILDELRMPSALSKAGGKEWQSIGRIWECWSGVSRQAYKHWRQRTRAHWCALTPPGGGMRQLRSGEMCSE